MTLGVNAVYEIRFTGDDTQAGYFNPSQTSAGTDYSQQDAAQVSYTDLVVDHTTNTKVTSAGNPFTSAHVGNGLRINSGTGWTTGLYEVVSVTGSTATLDRSPAAVDSTDGTGKLGGAIATPGLAFGSIIAGNTVWLKYSASTYNITSSTANVSGGRLSTNVGGQSRTQPFIFQGYDVTRGDLTSNRPTIKAAVNSIIMLVINGDMTRVSNIIFDRGTATGIDCVDVNGTGVTVFRCRAKADNLYGFLGTDGVCFIGCEAVNGTASYGFNLSTSNALFCVCKGWNGIGGFSNGRSALYCVATGITGDGFNMTNGDNGTTWLGNVAYNNTGSGFNFNNGTGGAVAVVNCIAYGHTGVSQSGFTGFGHWLFNCAAGNNSTNFASSFIGPVGNITLTANPFTNAASDDDSLNNTAGGGALCRAAGYATLPPIISTTSAPDVGVSQHGDPAQVPATHRIILGRHSFAG